MVVYSLQCPPCQSSPWGIYPVYDTGSRMRDWVKFIWNLKHKGIGAEEVFLYASVVVDTSWRTRNDKVHNNYTVDVKKCIDYICTSYADLHTTIFPSPSPYLKVSWSPPPQDWIKLNHDVRVGFDSMCLAVVARNHLGRVVWVQTSCVDFSDALCGEEAAYCLAILTAKDIGAKFVIVKSDSRVVINALNGKESH
uniref:RNase H type-1 domain-containing protein n=1 Tax=Cannabis sativa TaxID=3483 RepID=A0A803PAH9_CANSA